jgi:hypothetical protein
MSSRTSHIEVEQAFGEFCAAAARAQTTRKINDGIIAGQLWGRFLALYCPCTGPPERGFRCIAGGRIEAERRHRW